MATLQGDLASKPFCLCLSICVLMGDCVCVGERVYVYLFVSKNRRDSLFVCLCVSVCVCRCVHACVYICVFAE